VSCTDVLLNVATAARLFHASDGTGFADLIIDGHRETWPLRSKRFGAWLRQQYYERTWDAPSPAALNAALNALEAQAQFDGPQRKVSVRIAEHDGSTSIWRMSFGVASKSAPRDGRLPRARVPRPDGVWSRLPAWLSARRALPGHAATVDV
jgi:hypothetical protein